MNTKTRSLTAGMALLLMVLSLTTAVTLTAPRIVRAAGVRYAAPSAQGSGDCSSWGNACTLQTALTGAVSGDEIWVKAGVHYPGATGNRDATFQLKNGVAIYGGFAGTETSRNQRNPRVNQTILSGDIDQNDINTDGNFIAETPADIQGSNAYHVVNSGSTNSTAILDGFAITAGQANGSGSRGNGGGIVSYAGSPTLAQLVIVGNTAQNGGGMFNYNSSNPDLSNVVFVNNVSANSGGGMKNYVNCSPTLANVAFVNNKSTGSFGGAMSNNQSSPTLTNVVFKNNDAGIGVGSGIHNESSSPTLTNVTFNGHGGFSVIYNINSSNPVLRNVIMWGDSATSKIYSVNSSNPTISYSLIQGGCPSGATCGAGMLYVDPLFVDPANNNLRLQLTSPAIDAGDNTAVPSGITTDLDGNPRFVNIPTVPDTGNGSPPIVDMGAYEAQDIISPTVFSINRASPNPTNAASVGLIVTFSEPVTGVDTGDFSLLTTGSISGAGVTGLTGSGAIYTVTVDTGTGSGTLRLDVPETATVNDLNGNPLSSLPYTGGEVYDVDKTAPTVLSITRASPNPTNAPSVDFTVTFSENVAGVDVTDFAMTSGGDLFGANITGVNGSGAVYTVTASTGSGNGTLRLDIPDTASIHDAAGNSLTDLPYTEGQSYTIDKTAPTVDSVLRADPNPTNAESVRFIVSFSEGVYGVETADFTVTIISGNIYGAYVSEISSSGVTYTVTVSTGTGPGVLRLDVPVTATITDLEGNALSGLPYTSGETYTLNRAQVFYAASTVQGSGNCFGWTNACTLQTALAQAQSGDEIWVKAGVHYPTTNPTDRTATFTLKNGVAVYGGFAGTETRRDQRNWQANLTILSGDIDGDDTNTDGNFIAETWNDIQGSNAYHVVTGSGTSSTAVLDGFIITAGQANGSNPNDRGGGMYNYGGSPTLRNLTFSGNSAAYAGGGMYNENNSSPTLTNVTFSGNSADFGGGGMYNYYSSPTLTNVTFSGNSADYGGGMLNTYNSSPTLTNVILWGDTAPNGPEIYNYSSTPVVSYSDIQGGYAGTGNINANPLFVNAAGGDLRLQLTSPAIDAGNNAAVPAGVTTDLDGRPRFIDIPTVPDTGYGTPPIVDMGAYEAQYVDVALGNAVSPQTVLPGQVITFTLALSASGSLPATGLVVTDTLPSFLRNVSFISSLLITNTGYTPPYVWQVQDLAPGKSGVITVTGVLTVPLAAGTYTNTAVITATGDLVAENNTAVVTFTVTNVAPAFTSAPVVTATQDAPYTYTATARDDNGDILTLTAPTLPGWLTLVDHGDGTATLSGTPTNADVGDHAVVLRVTDRGGLSDTQAFTVTVPNVNDAPSFTSTPVLTTTQGAPYTYAVTATDPDLIHGDALTLTAPTLPAWLTLVDHGDGTATLSGTPTNADVGDHAVVLRVTDRAGAFTEQAFNITVAEKPLHYIFLPLVLRSTP